MTNATLRRISTTFLLILIYVVVAAASFHGYFSKWSFRDSSFGNSLENWVFREPSETPPVEFSLDKMLDGTASRPFVYRQLIPQIANGLDKVTPNRIKKRLANKSEYVIEPTYASAKLEALRPNYVFRYGIIYTITFASLLISMFLLREICIETSKSSIYGTLAPIIFALLFPFILTRGGYFYDFSELMFFTASFLLALRKHLIWILPITLLATLNKESFFFFIFTLIPLIQPFVSRYQLLKFISSTVLISAMTNIIVKSIYAENMGSTAWYQFGDNVRFYLNPFNYLFAFETNYGLWLPKASSIFGLVALFIVISESWSSLQRPIKQHTLFALAINIPLFLVFCWKDELRNLSMLFVPFSIMITVYLKNILGRTVEMQSTD